MNKGVWFFLSYAVLGSFSMYSFRALGNSLTSSYNPLVLKSFPTNEENKYKIYYNDKVFIKTITTNTTMTDTGTVKVYVNDRNKNVLTTFEYQDLIIYDIFKYALMSIIIVLVTLANPIFKFPLYKYIPFPFLSSFYTNPSELNKEFTRKELFFIICALVVINYPVYYTVFL